jgi:DNA-binding MarR family transcriptional regulator
MGTNTSAAGAAAQPNDTRFVLDAIRRIVQALRESSRSAERHVGLSGAQVFVLNALADGAPLSLNELAAATHTHQSSVSTVVTHLVDQGLVRRDRSRDDARRLDLTLTPKGRRLVDRAPDAAQHRLIAAIARLPAGRRRSLASTLTALADAVADVDRIPPMFFEERKRTRAMARRRASGGA